MSKFFLELHECGDVTPDQDGLEAEDLDAARVIATTAARGIMSAEISEGNLRLSCSIEILDEQRTVLDRIMFRDAIQISGL